MKRRPRERKFDSRSNSFTLSKAKSYLGRLVEKASKGEAVYILAGQRRYLLQEIQAIEPIPFRPAGYFNDCYPAEEIRDDNRLASASVIDVPRDLE
ncbi:MAG TPA: hypothetical protein VHH73_08965 [Verrucomicrobiae bacterium]|nr:hypothetical protein [Verrucomicrobiae bacterium]